MVVGKVLSFRSRHQPAGLFSSNIQTNCNGVEKTTTILYGKTVGIDVDNNPETGNENGADIDVKFLIYPWVEISSDIGVGVIFSLLINRLGEEIKDSDFSIVCAGFFRSLD